MLWTDKWMNSPLITLFPELHSFAINEDITLFQAHQHEDLSHIFYRPLSLQAFNQFNLLQEQVHSSIQTDEEDQWRYTWTSTKYSSMKMYINISEKTEAHTIFK